MVPPELSLIANDVQNRPIVSIVIPTWNRAQELKETVNDLVHQTLRDLEIFIIDDQSPDNTEDVGKQLAESDPRIQFYRLPLKGFVYGAMNEGICRSRGRYIYIAHDHDRYLPTLLEKLVALFNGHESVVYAFTGLETWSHDYVHQLATFVHDLPNLIGGAWWRNQLLSHYHCPVPAQSMIRRNALERIGLFDPEFGASTDVEMWIRLCEIGDVGYIREPLMRLRGRDSNHHYVYNWKIIDEVARIHHHHMSKSSFNRQHIRHLIRFYREYDWVMLSMFLSARKRRKANVVNEGRNYLRKHGVFLSRLASYLA
jgi:glycosyltransferase involved in cell wall biosynthesis